MDDQKERIRLLADRLCYREHGMKGVRWRHGMWRAKRRSGLTYWDKYDTQATKLAPTVLKERKLPQFGQLRMF